MKRIVIVLKIILLIIAVSPLLKPGSKTSPFSSPKLLVSNTTSTKDVRGGDMPISVKVPEG